MRTREEQISALACAIFNQHIDIDECITLARNYILKAERRAEQRVRAECAADTRRLEWLEKLPFADVRRLPNGWEICINNVRHWDMRPTLRTAIDAAMEGGK